MSSQPADGTIAAMRGPGQVRVSLAIEASADSVAGTVRSDDHAEQPFSGWMELFSLLEATIRTACEEAGTQPQGEENP